jgi:hypothetical protein
VKLTDRAVPVDLTDPHADLSPFAVFDDLAERARVAFLVEMDHFIAEKSAFRLLCIRYLATKGWRWFGEEVDPRVGARLDTYLTDGDESMLEPINEDPWYTSGVLARPAGEHDDLSMQRDRAELVRRVRGAVPQSRWFGFDIGGEDADYLAAANAANTYAELDPVMALRERKIHARVDRFMAERPDEKVALLAGSLHLMKRDDLVTAPGVTGPGGSTVCSLGHHVATTHEGPILAFWLLHGEGTSANPYLPPPGELRPGKESLNAELLEACPSPVVLRVDDDRTERSVTHMHNLDLRCRLADQVDGIVFAPTVTPLPKR